MEKVMENSSTPAETEESIALRLERTLRIVREDEARLKRILEVRRLRRRARQELQSR